MLRSAKRYNRATVRASVGYLCAFGVDSDSARMLRFAESARRCCGSATIVRCTDIEHEATP